MKNLIFGICLLFFLSGCNESSKAEAAKVNSMGTYTYDSCEYVGMNLSWGSAVLVHKGNCKYCIQRKGDVIK